MNQLTHEVAAHRLRVLVMEKGEQNDTDGLDFILDELHTANFRNGKLVAELDTVRRDYAHLVAEKLAADQRRAQVAVVRAAEEHRHGA